jgi:hypothetical protein
MTFYSIKNDISCFNVLNYVEKTQSQWRDGDETETKSKNTGLKIETETKNTGLKIETETEAESECK